MLDKGCAIALVLALLAGVGCAGFFSFVLLSGTTEGAMRGSIEKNLPPGSSEADVTHYLKRLGYVYAPADGEGLHRLQASTKGRYSLGCTGARVVALFSFDAADTLIDYSVHWFANCF